MWRQPFPGPGLGVRIVGEVTRERAEILRNADHVVVEEIRRAGLYRELWQSFAVLPAVRTVGVMGDGRTYAYPIVIRAVTSDDAMTADWARLPYDVIERIAYRIINEVDGREPRGARRDVEAARAPLSGSDRDAGEWRARSLFDTSTPSDEAGRDAAAAADGGGRRRATPPTQGADDGRRRRRRSPPRPGAFAGDPPRCSTA